MNEQERLQILEMIEKGVITAEEGVRLLNSLQDEPEEPSTPLIGEPIGEASRVVENPAPVSSSEASQEVVEENPPQENKDASSARQFESEISKWRRWWWIPLTVGIAITVISGLIMFLVYQSGGFGFWFACLWFPLLFGVLVISLSAASRTARWLHVRVQQAPGERPQTIRISLPIPIRLTAWVLRVIKPWVPGLEKAGVDDAVLALKKISPDEPFYVKVDEDDSGEKVEVFIG